MGEDSNTDLEEATSSAEKMECDKEEKAMDNEETPEAMEPVPIENDVKSDDKITEETNESVVTNSEDAKEVSDDSQVEQHKSTSVTKDSDTAEDNPSVIASKESTISEEKPSSATAQVSAEMKSLQSLQSLLLNRVPRQKPKSGKFWKQERAEFRSLKKDKGTKRTFEERVRLKEEKQRNNEMASMMIQEKINRKQALRQRIEENKKQKAERQLKNEVFQVVTNPNKIKKIKKRDLAKRDILGKMG